MGSIRHVQREIIESLFILRLYIDNQPSFLCDSVVIFLFSIQVIQCRARRVTLLSGNAGFKSIDIGLQLRADIERRVKEGDRKLMANFTGGALDGDPSKHGIFCFDGINDADVEYIFVPFDDCRLLKLLLSFVKWFDLADLRVHKILLINMASKIYDF